jgi:N-acetylneuraminic acid mutarotase
MKSMSKIILLLMLLFAAAQIQLRAQGTTAFTYQGRLNFNGGPASGIYDFRFRVATDAAGNSFLGNPVLTNGLPVTNGLFTTMVDFGPGIFSGASLWLQVEVRTNGAGNYTVLNPLQPFTVTPYATFASTANSVSGTISASQLVGTIPASSIGTGTITSSNLAPGAAAANLAAGGGAPVAGGGTILSESGNATNLINAGYVKIGKVTLINESWVGKTNATAASFQRAGHTAVWTGSEMLVWGGGTVSSFIDTGLRYNPTTDTWTKMSLSPAQHYYGSLSSYSVVWTGTEMIIWGGQDDNALSTAINTGARYKPATDTWALTSTVNAPSPRLQHSAIWTGSSMVVWGGWYSDYYGILTYNNGGRYNPSTDTWQPVNTTNAPSARMGHAAVWTGTQMLVWGGEYVYGGGFGAGALLVTNCARYNPSSDTWSSMSTNGQPALRMSPTGLWTGSEMIIWGGNDGGSTPFNDGARYNPTANTWTTMSSAGAPSARQSYSAVWAGSKMIVWGGYDTAFQNSGYSYTPGNNTWTNISATGAPTARYGHTAVWTGTEMIVWGGSDGQNSYPLLGGRYNPTSNSWVPTGVSADSPERSDHTAVWTGNEMIIWGGYNGALLGNGLRYNPAIDVWAPVAASGSPTARRYHSAVWTGTEMLIWGGYNNGTLQTGARYNPTLNTWANITTNNAPVGRQSHVAVWTGNEMIVWGGTAGSFVLITRNDGGRYNPTNDTWTAVSTNVPLSTRIGHTAVWTGKEMIVWGGSVLSTPYGDGARYNPMNDIWTPVSMTNAPTPRSLHTAVWTGKEMIIWGGVAPIGLNTNAYFNTGGRYDPVSDTWTTTSTIGAPTGRSGHNAVWAGTQMIIVGSGSDNPNGGVFYGGCYLPADDKWSPMSAGSGLTQRYSFSTVWDGTEMLLWGGLSGSTYYKDTWLYTPGRFEYLYLKP